MVRLHCARADDFGAGTTRAYCADERDQLSEPARMCPGVRVGRALGPDVFEYPFPANRIGLVPRRTIRVDQFDQGLAGCHFQNFSCRESARSLRRLLLLRELVGVMRI